MLKGNNKGFAITTVLYGLSIMGILITTILMSTMSSTRTNNADVVKSIEHELNLISKSETNFYATPTGGGTPTYQEYVVPEGQSGTYRIELWGCQGGNGNGGLGAYTSGLIILEEGDRLYFYVGSMNGRGGWATEVRAEFGPYNDSTAEIPSVRTRIMVAAGGGSNAGASGGTLYGYTSRMNPLGGYIGIDGTLPLYNLIAADSTPVAHKTNGSLAGYAGGTSPYVRSSLTYLDSGTANWNSLGVDTGGDGYYSTSDANMGGVSYISGYAGVKSIGRNGGIFTGEHATYFEYVDVRKNEDTDTFVYQTNDKKKDKYIFFDARMYPGVNAGNGRAKIERISDSMNREDLKRNSALKGKTYRYVKDCTNNANDFGGGFKISVISAGRDLAAGKALNAQNSGSAICRYIDLGGAKSIDEIAVWHANGDGKDPKNHQLYVGTSTSAWTALLDIHTTVSESESVTGIRVSAYQHKAGEALKTGDYYIVPVIAEGKAVSAAASATASAQAIKIEPLDGNKRQKWKIEKLSNGYYKIMELARYKALSIGMSITGSGTDGTVSSTDENVEKNFVRAYESFNAFNLNDMQLWEIQALPDGTYVIKTKLAPPWVSAVEGETIKRRTDNCDPGHIMPIPNLNNSTFKDKVIISCHINGQPYVTQRFKLISVDYSSS